MSPDAIVVGSGPNGLTAAILLARAGLSVQLYEASDTVGGGMRSAELTLPGFTHDVCSAIHPFGYASPVFRQFPLEQFGLKWLWSPAAVAHPLDDGRAITLELPTDETCRQFPEDAQTYKKLFDPAAEALNDFLDAGLTKLARHAPSNAHLGVLALRSAHGVIDGRFYSTAARALLAGNAGHALLPLEKASSFGIVLGLVTAGHGVGWPFPEGGSQKLADALAAYFRSLGGEIITSTRIRSLHELPPSLAVLLDVPPRQVLDICGERLPPMYSKVLSNFRHTMGVFKIDFALSEPVPWRSPEAKRAATLHLGGTLEDIAFGERELWFGRIPDRPMVLAAQHTLFDTTRAPDGKHTLWAYCHVPNGSRVDMTERIESQIERFAPGFRDCILARHVMSPAKLESHNPNLIGGDITGGDQDLAQLAVRPSLRYWATPLPEVFICSSSTPPGAGVHGMCGFFAAQLALKRRFGIRVSEIQR